jgi:hypothetical protein
VAVQSKLISYYKQLLDPETEVGELLKMVEVNHLLGNTFDYAVMYRNLTILVHREIQKKI